jgi:hypothetical protein
MIIFRYIKECIKDVKIMASKNKNFVDDGWAVWIEGDDVSTVYINDWINPNGKSWVDFAIKINGIKKSKNLNIYVPFFLNCILLHPISVR